MQQVRKLPSKILADGWCKKQVHKLDSYEDLFLSSSGYYACRRCKNETERARKKRVRDGVQPREKQREGFCRADLHMLQEGSFYLNNQGYKICLPCKSPSLGYKGRGSLYAIKLDCNHEVIFSVPPGVEEILWCIRCINYRIAKSGKVVPIVKEEERK